MKIVILFFISIALAYSAQIKIEFFCAITKKRISGVQIKIKNKIFLNNGVLLPGTHQANLAFSGYENLQIFIIVKQHQKLLHITKILKPKKRSFALFKIDYNNLCGFSCNYITVNGKKPLPFQLFTPEHRYDVLLKTTGYREIHENFILPIGEGPYGITTLDKFLRLPSYSISVPKRYKNLKIYANNKLLENYQIIRQNGFSFAHYKFFTENISKLKIVSGIYYDEKKESKYWRVFRDLRYINGDLLVVKLKKLPKQQAIDLLQTMMENKRDQQKLYSLNENHKKVIFSYIKKSY